MSSHEEQLRSEMVEAGRRLYARAYIASNDGNISARLDEHRLITTPKSVSKGFMTPDMMVIVDYDGRRSRAIRSLVRPAMHIEVYRKRRRECGVPRASPMATGFAVAGIPPPCGDGGSRHHDEALPRRLCTPSTSNCLKLVRKYIKANDGIGFANHGAGRAVQP